MLVERLFRRVTMLVSVFGEIFALKIVAVDFVGMFILRFDAVMVVMARLRFKLVITHLPHRNEG